MQESWYFDLNPVYSSVATFVKVEIHIGEYLRKKEEDSVQALSLYLDAMIAVGDSWYKGEYPLVLIDNLIYLWIKVMHKKHTTLSYIVIWLKNSGIFQLDTQ